MDSPGVYVLEVASGSAPIAGVGTGTAAFIGVLPDAVQQPEVVQVLGYGDGSRKTFVLGSAFAPSSVRVAVDGAELPSDHVEADAENRAVVLTDAPVSGARVSVTYRPPDFAAPDPGKPLLCTTWADYARTFGGFGTGGDSEAWLPWAVYGFFANGGTRCFVVRLSPPAHASTPVDVTEALTALSAIDEVALVAVPGLTGEGAGPAVIRAAVLDHCLGCQDRFAIFDSPLDLAGNNLQALGKDGTQMPPSSDYAALYFPWLGVHDPARGRDLWVPPSGHVAGVYARVDASRGVHKAPANEEVRGGVTDLRYPVGRVQQNGLNPHGVNCIREINGTIRIWGARTLGGDANGEWKYVNVRRLFLYLRESIDEGMQWTVFEPNTPALWAKIRLNITAFLTNVWREGGLFGASPEDAFRVQCDEQTNPREVRDLGRVVTVVGVKVASPAEFVVFEISQLAQAAG
jgi:hypothetical protein